MEVLKHDGIGDFTSKSYYVQLGSIQGPKWIKIHGPKRQMTHSSIFDQVNIILNAKCG